jgi:hypothetical protein
MNIELLILANSRKLGARCIAGIDINEKKNEKKNFFRIVKPFDNPIPNEEGYRYAIMNVVEFSGVMPEKSKYNYHSENITYDEGIIVGALNGYKITNFLQNPEDIFGEGNYIPYEEAQRLDHSLIFVRVYDFKMYVSEYQGKKKIRCAYDYNGIRYYDMPVTDVSKEERIDEIPTRGEKHRSALITVSLGEPYMGNAYKLVAGILLPQY